MKVLLRLLGFLGSHRRQVALAVVLGVVTMATNLGLLSVAAYLVAASALQYGLSQLTLPISLVQVFGLSRAVSRYLERMVSHNVTFKLLASLRTWLYGRLEPLSPARLLQHRSGDLLARIVKDVEELENIYLRAFSPVIVAVAISTLTFVVLYAFDSLLAFVTLGFLALSGVGVPLLVNALARSLGRRELELTAGLNTQIVDGIQGVQDLLALDRASEQQRKISDLGSRLARVQRRMASITGLQNTLNDLTMNLAMLTILILAIPAVNEGRIPAVYLAFLALLVLGSFEAVQPLGTAFQFLGRSLGAGERLFEIADARPQVTFPDKPLPPPADHTLEFDRVSFRYHEDAPSVLNGVSFRVDPGNRVAIVGPSGSGKSTIANLALRFWDPAEGEIRLGGHDLRGYTEDDLRDAIGVAAQDTHLFNETLRDNLLLARPGATDSEIGSALEKAQLTGFVSSLPQGLDAPLGEQGLRLSGGERQRLAGARALLRDTPVLILDEPTANLDPATERELLAGIYEQMPDRATLVITHRLVHMERMDAILILEEGRIVERGTHQALLKKNGLYKRMVEVQDQMLATV
ncbi:MAG: thiol reductant ABC exporter subunit CydC [Actinobacteria bacterium]|nr:thiol reductant ABC exporter subunit CydC [Actinomycetota bacterium]